MTVKHTDSIRKADIPVDRLSDEGKCLLAAEEEANAISTYLNMAENSDGALKESFEEVADDEAEHLGKVLSAVSSIRPELLEGMMNGVQESEDEGFDIDDAVTDRINAKTEKPSEVDFDREIESAIRKSLGQPERSHLTEDEVAEIPSDFMAWLISRYGEEEISGFKKAVELKDSKYYEKAIEKIRDASFKKMNALLDKMKSHEKMMTSRKKAISSEAYNETKALYEKTKDLYEEEKAFFEYWDKILERRREWNTNHEIGATLREREKTFLEEKKALLEKRADHIYVVRKGIKQNKGESYGDYQKRLLGELAKNKDITADFKKWQDENKSKGYSQGDHAFRNYIREIETDSRDIGYKNPDIRAKEVESEKESKLTSEEFEKLSDEDRLKWLKAMNGDDYEPYNWESQDETKEEGKEKKKKTIMPFIDDQLLMESISATKKWLDKSESGDTEGDTNEERSFNLFDEQKKEADIKKKIEDLKDEIKYYIFNETHDPKFTDAPDWLKEADPDTYGPGAYAQHEDKIYNSKFVLDKAKEIAQLEGSDVASVIADLRGLEDPHFAVTSNLDGDKPKLGSIPDESKSQFSVFFPNNSSMSEKQRAEAAAAAATLGNSFVFGDGRNFTDYNHLGLNSRNMTPGYIDQARDIAEMIYNENLADASNKAVTTGKNNNIKYQKRRLNKLQEEGFDRNTVKLKNSEKTIPFLVHALLGHVIPGYIADVLFPNIASSMKNETGGKYEKLFDSYTGKDTVPNAVLSGRINTIPFIPERLMRRDPFLMKMGNNAINIGYVRRALKSVSDDITSGKIEFADPKFEEYARQYKGNAFTIGVFKELLKKNPIMVIKTVDGHPIEVKFSKHLQDVLDDNNELGESFNPVKTKPNEEDDFTPEESSTGMTVERLTEDLNKIPTDADKIMIPPDFQGSKLTDVMFAILDDVTSKKGDVRNFSDIMDGVRDFEERYKNRLLISQNKTQYDRLIGQSDRLRQLKYGLLAEALFKKYYGIILEDTRKKAEKDAAAAGTDKVAEIDTKEVADRAVDAVSRILADDKKLEEELTQFDKTNNPIIRQLNYIDALEDSMSWKDEAGKPSYFKDSEGRDKVDNWKRPTDFEMYTGGYRTKADKEEFEKKTDDEQKELRKGKYKYFNGFDLASSPFYMSMDTVTDVLKRYFGSAEDVKKAYETAVKEAKKENSQASSEEITKIAKGKVFRGAVEKIAENYRSWQKDQDDIAETNETNLKNPDNTNLGTYRWFAPTDDDFDVLYEDYYIPEGASIEEGNDGRKYELDENKKRIYELDDQNRRTFKLDESGNRILNKDPFGNTLIKLGEDDRPVRDEPRTRDEVLYLSNNPDKRTKFDFKDKKGKTIEDAYKFMLPSYISESGDSSFVGERAGNLYNAFMSRQIFRKYSKKELDALNTLGILAKRIAIPSKLDRSSKEKFKADRLAFFLDLTDYLLGVERSNPKEGVEEIAKWYPTAKHDPDFRKKLIDFRKRAEGGTSINGDDIKGIFVDTVPEMNELRKRFSEENSDSKPLYSILMNTAKDGDATGNTVEDVIKNMSDEYTTLPGGLFSEEKGAKKAEYEKTKAYHEYRKAHGDPVGMIDPSDRSKVIRYGDGMSAQDMFNKMYLERLGLPENEISAAMINKIGKLILDSKLRGISTDNMTKNEHPFDVADAILYAINNRFGKNFKYNDKTNRTYSGTVFGEGRYPGEFGTIGDVINASYGLITGEEGAPGKAKAALETLYKRVPSQDYLDVTEMAANQGTINEITDEDTGGNESMKEDLLQDDPLLQVKEDAANNIVGSDALNQMIRDEEKPTSDNPDGKSYPTAVKDVIDRVVKSESVNKPAKEKAIKGAKSRIIDSTAEQTPIRTTSSHPIWQPTDYVMPLGDPRNHQVGDEISVKRDQPDGTKTEVWDIDEEIKKRQK